MNKTKQLESNKNVQTALTKLVLVDLGVTDIKKTQSFKNIEQEWKKEKKDKRVKEKKGDDVCDDNGSMKRREGTKRKIN